MSALQIDILVRFTMPGYIYVFAAICLEKDMTIPTCTNESQVSRKDKTQSLMHKLKASLKRIMDFPSK